MTTFHSIDELLKMMSREQLLLKQMFGKRKQQSFRREYALELTEYKLQRIQSLIDHGVLRENGSFLEMEDIYLHFFEQVLEVNEEINTSFVNEHISYLKDTISYYQQENHEKRKTTYLRTIKRILRNYNPQIQISAESGTKRSIFRQKNKTKRSKNRLHTTLIKPEQKVNEDLCSGFVLS